MLLNDMKEELRRFAEIYCLVFKFKEDRHMRHNVTWGIAVCESITYIYTFINPRTGYTREFVTNHTDVINIGDELVRAIKDNVLSDLNLVDRMKKPEYMTDNVTINLDCNGLADYVRKSRPEPFKVPERILSNDETKAQYKYFSDKWAKAREELMKPTIEKVYFNKPYTIVIWSDKTKTMVKATDEAYDEEKGLAMAICKKFLGTNKNKSNYFEEFKKWLPEKNSKPVVKEVYLTVKEFAKISGQGLTTVRKDCARGLHPGAKKVDGKWLIPYEGMVKGGK